MYYFCIKNFLTLLFEFLINFTGGRTDCFNLRFSKSETNDTISSKKRQVKIGGCAHIAYITMYGFYRFLDF